MLTDVSIAKLNLFATIISNSYHTKFSTKLTLAIVYLLFTIITQSIEQDVDYFILKFLDQFKL
jgi:hypothetical protein